MPETRENTFYWKQAEYPFFAQGTAKKVILSFLFWELVYIWTKYDKH